MLTLPPIHPEEWQGIEDASLSTVFATLHNTGEFLVEIVISITKDH